MSARVPRLRRRSGCRIVSRAWSWFADPAALYNGENEKTKGLGITSIELATRERPPAPPRRTIADWHFSTNNKCFHRKVTQITTQRLHRTHNLFLTKLISAATEPTQMTNCSTMFTKLNYQVAFSKSIDLDDLIAQPKAKYKFGVWICVISNVV